MRRVTLCAPAAWGRCLATSQRLIVVEQGRELSNRALPSARQLILGVFLPQDYERQVAPSYLRFSAWQFIHMTSGSATGVLSTQALLHAIGLGAGAIPAAAALNWIIKDGLGQLGGVLYAGLVATRFDSDPKRYRFVAAGVLQAATLLEVLTPMVPGAFLPLASLSNIGKNIAWIATSASRAQLHLQLLQGAPVRTPVAPSASQSSSSSLSSSSIGLLNVGDLTAKAGTQSTAAGLIGTALGAVVASFVGTDVAAVMAAYLPLAGLSLATLYASNRAVALATLNPQRLDLAIEPWLRDRTAPPASPDHVTLSERVFGPARRVLVCPRVSSVLGHDDVQRVFGQPNLPYPYYVAHIGPGRAAVWVERDAAPATLLRAYVHGALTARLDSVAEAHAEMLAHYEALRDRLGGQGWDLERLHLDEGEPVAVTAMERLGQSESKRKTRLDRI